MAAPNQRRSLDLWKLMRSGRKTEQLKDDMSEWKVEFKGPSNSLYEGGVWYVELKVPDDYPYRPPSVRFLNKIMHPNIHFQNGLVCVNLLKEQVWSTAFDIVYIFEEILPELLQCPNPEDPLDEQAAELMLTDKEDYEKTVKVLCKRFANADGNLGLDEQEGGSDDKERLGSNDAERNVESGLDERLGSGDEEPNAESGSNDKERVGSSDEEPNVKSGSDDKERVGSSDEEPNVESGLDDKERVDSSEEEPKGLDVKSGSDVKNEL